MDYEAQQQLELENAQTMAMTQYDRRSPGSDEDEEDNTSIVEVDNKEFPPHILADLQKDVIYNA